MLLFKDMDILEHHFNSYGNTPVILYVFPPPPCSEIRRAPPTLVGTNFDLPIIPYRDIEFNY